MQYIKTCKKKHEASGVIRYQVRIVYFLDDYRCVLNVI
jgi:hypothetical protein